MNVKLAKVDTTIHKKLAEKFNIKGFPTLTFFKDGVESEYKGGSKNIIFLNKNI